jgi:hypothetical protein
MRADCTCGRPLIRAEECVTGFPDHHVKGSRVAYCSECGPVPTLTLTIGDGGCELQANPVGVEAPGQSPDP